MKHENAALKRARADCEAARRTKEQGFTELQEAIEQFPLRPEDIAELNRSGWSGKPKQKGHEQGVFNGLESVGGE